MNLTFGINLGGWMSQTRRYRPEFITEADFAAIRDMGFDHVRLPVDFDILADCGTTPLTRSFGSSPTWLEPSAPPGRQSSSSAQRPDLAELLARGCSALGETCPDLPHS